MKKFLSPLLLIALLGLTGLLAGCAGQNTAPKLKYTTIAGQVIEPADYQGQVMLVNFWATSCSSCVKEMPEIVNVYEKYKNQGFRTIAVSMGYDRPDYVMNFAKSRQLPFDVVLDLSGSIAKAFNDVKITPTTYLIDRNGDIVKTYVGEPDFSALNALVEKLLAEKSV